MSTPFVFSAPGSLKHPKSPKSPKSLENPLLKTNHSFLFAPNPGLAAHEQRTPLLSVTNNNNNHNHNNDFGNSGMNGSGSTPTFRRTAPTVKATPGPPPKKSLSFSVSSGASHGYSWQNPVAPIINTTDEVPVPPAMNTPIFGNGAQQNKRSAFSTNTGSSSMNNHVVDVDHPLQQHWVVAYGFTNHAESHAMLEILQENGHIVSKKSGKNWIAVQYDDELSVARATCRQVVQLPHGGGVLCGIAKANGQLVQELVASAAIGPSLNNTAVVPAPLPALEGQPTSLSNGGAKEDDILDFGPRSRSTATPMDTDDDDDAPTGTSMQGQRPSQSICEKFFHWYLGWDVKTHED